MLISRNEAKKILGKKADALCRFWPNGCPFDAKSKFTLQVDMPDSKQPVTLAFCTVRSIRPVSEGTYSASGLLKGEGWSHISSWKRNLSDRYGQIPSDNLWRITFNVDKTVEDVERQQKTQDANKRRSPSR